MDTVCTLVNELCLERFPKMIVGAPRSYDWRYHFGQFLLVIVGGRGEGGALDSNCERKCDVTPLGLEFSVIFGVGHPPAAIVDPWPSELVYGGWISRVVRRACPKRRWEGYRRKARQRVITARSGPRGAARRAGEQSKQALAALDTQVDVSVR